MISIYTDGASRGNPGPGGYGAVLISGPHRKELSQGFKLTTNNRMEIIAAVQALKCLKSPCQGKLFTDSTYLKQGVNSWLAKWKANNWRGSDKKPVKNIDLWQELDAVALGNGRRGRGSAAFASARTRRDADSRDTGTDDRRRDTFVSSRCDVPDSAERQTSSGRGRWPVLGARRVQPRARGLCRTGESLHPSRAGVGKQVALSKMG